METDEEVGLIPWDREIATQRHDSQIRRVQRIRTNCAGLLRRELGHRAEQYARAHGLPHCLSYGQPPTVCFEPYDGDARHGNFLPSTYKAILRNAGWGRRLQKVHSLGGKSLPRAAYGTRRELDSCTSSDALLMNVFCCPQAFRDGRLYSMLNVRPGATPEFGFRARVPLTSEKLDRTEVDMRLGDLLVEAKLTESDFQRAPKTVLNAYRNVCEVFSCEGLPQTRSDCLSYQLIRNILAAHSSDCSFCLLTDARRADLIEAWYAVIKCVSPVELRLRCRVLTWQELAHVLPRTLREFLAEKYGIIRSSPVRWSPNSGRPEARESDGVK